MKVGELCAGYQGISMGLRLVGEDVDLRWLAESDRALDVLHPLGVPNLGDITTVDWSAVEPVDLLTAGFPCQPVSAAGAQLAEADPRWLWPEVRRAVAALLPPRVLLENVRNLISMRKGEIWRYILADLTDLGYDVTWLTLGACAVGAAHHRHRVFALATLAEDYDLDGARYPQIVERLDVQECGARSGALLPTVTSSEGTGPGAAGDGGLNLRTVTVLLPTPSTSNAHGNHVNNRDEPLLPGAVQPEHWGRFAAAVQRHAGTFGPPPAPTEPNRNGAPRLAPAFAEWLMCIPAGHVTDALPRSQALKAIGNGVCPPQLAQAWRYLTGLDRPSDTSIGFHAMTSSTTTSQDVKAIQDRQSNGRGAVIAAGFKAEGTSARGIDDEHMAEIIEAAMMALVEHWRAEADIWEASKKRGGIGTAKELRQCASRLAGFAVGLTSRSVTLADAEAVPVGGKIVVGTEEWTKIADGCDRCDKDMHRCPGCGDAVSHGMVACAQCSHGDPGTAFDLATSDVVAALPAGDPVADQLNAAFGEGAVSTFLTEVAQEFAATAQLLTGDEQVGTKVTVGGIEFTRIGTNPFGPDQSEEDNLRDIIGPLGASATALVDNPFTRPNVPWLNRPAVAVVAYQDLPGIAAATGMRDHVSHSYVEGYESCSLASMLKDASRAGHIGASRPGWSQIAGKAFHAAVEAVERAALTNVTLAPTGPDLEAFWMAFFDTEIKEQLAALVGTPYADSGTWYVSNRGKEGFDWWRVEGARMLQMYLDHHTPAWRTANQTFLLQDKTPVIELEYDMTIRSLDEERGLRAKGFIDKATLNMETYSLTVLDYKTGARDPDSTFQLGEYGHALLMAMGIPQEPADRPILGSYWLARKGIYTTPTAVLQRHPLTELQYRYDQAARGNKAGIFAPHVSNFCTSCSVKDYCPTQAGRT